MSEKKIVVTSLVCPNCESLHFEPKGQKGNLMLMCSTCHTKVNVTKGGGIVDVKAVPKPGSKGGFHINEMEVDGKALFPEARVRAPAKKVATTDEKKEVWYDLRYQVPESNKCIIQAAQWCAKSLKKVKGKWFAGSVITHICAEFLGSFDYRQLDPKDHERVISLLTGVADLVEDEEAYKKSLEELDSQYVDLTIEQAKKVVSVIPKLDERGKVIAEDKAKKKQDHTKAMVRGKGVSMVKRRLEKLKALNLSDAERDNWILPCQVVLETVQEGKKVTSDPDIAQFIDKVDTFLSNKEKLDNAIQKEKEKAAKKKVEPTHEEAVAILNDKLVKVRIQLGKAKSSEDAGKVAEVQQTIDEIKNAIEGLKNHTLIPSDLKELLG